MFHNSHGYVKIIKPFVLGPNFLINRILVILYRPHQSFLDHLIPLSQGPEAVASVGPRDKGAVQ